MARKQTDNHSDELVADSLQVENYLKQGRECQRYTVQLGIEHGIKAYLERYQVASPQLQFKIFLFSSFYGEKVKRFLEDIRGEHYA